MKQRTKIILSVIPLLIWLIVIFMFSAKPAFESGQQSGALVKILKECLSGVAPKANQSLINWNFVETIIRKAAHFTVYFILGMLSLNLADKIIKNRKSCIITAFIFSVLYAVSDEIHQAFVPGRACRLFDVALDSLGAFIGIMVLYNVLKKCFGRYNF